MPEQGEVFELYPTPVVPVIQELEAEPVRLGLASFRVGEDVEVLNVDALGYVGSPARLNNKSRGKRPGVADRPGIGVHARVSLPHPVEDAHVLKVGRSVGGQLDDDLLRKLDPVAGRYYPYTRAGGDFGQNIQPGGQAAEGRRRCQNAQENSAQVSMPFPLVCDLSMLSACGGLSQPLDSGLHRNVEWDR